MASLWLVTGYLAGAAKDVAVSSGCAAAVMALQDKQLLLRGERPVTCCTAQQQHYHNSSSSSSMCSSRKHPQQHLVQLKLQMMMARR